MEREKICCNWATCCTSLFWGIIVSLCRLVNLGGLWLWCSGLSPGGGGGTPVEGPQSGSPWCYHAAICFETMYIVLNCGCLCISCICSCFDESIFPVSPWQESANISDNRLQSATLHSLCLLIFIFSSYICNTSTYNSVKGLFFNYDT